MDKAAQFVTCLYRDHSQGKGPGLSKKTLLLACFLILCVACSRQVLPEKSAALSPETRVNRYLQDLTGNSFAGRKGGSRGEARAALYLARHLQKAGIQPAGEGDTYFQSFPIAEYEPVLVDKRMTFRMVSGGPAGSSANVLGYIPGQQEEIIVLSAHYDHLGTIGGTLYPGANDNASGVALIMELLTELKKETPQYSILIAFWGAEEMGLLGSSFFCDNPTVSWGRIKCIVNLDSIGNLRPDKKLLGWQGGQNELSNTIIDIIDREGWSITWEKAEKNNSDHYPFFKKGVAGFTLLSPAWLEFNHTPQDTMEIVEIGLLLEFMDALKKAFLA